MTHLTLALSAAFAFVAALVYATVGRTIAARHVEPAARGPWTAFALWWYGLAASTAVGAVQSVTYAAGSRDLAVFVTFTLLALLIVCIVLWCLLYYLSYLFTGSRIVLGPLTAFYVLFYFGLVYIVTASGPIGLEERGWSVALAYERPLEGPLVGAFILFLLGPQFLGAVAYFTLFFQTRDPTARYRILLVSWSIIVWFGSTYAVSLAGAQRSVAWQAASRLIGLAAALTILLAYHPPVWVRRRFHVAAIDEAR